MDKRYTKECSLRTSAICMWQDITASVTTLAERYEQMLGATEKSLNDLGKRVNDHLIKTGFEV